MSLQKLTLFSVLFDMIFGQLSEVLFQAEKTSYPISWDYTGHDGLTLRFDGFTDKLFGIFCYVLDAIAQFNVAAHDFTYYCNRFFNSLWERDPSGIDSYGEQCNPRAVLNGLLSENTYSPRCLLDAVKELSQGEVQDALILLKAQVQVTMLVYGNINSQDALKYEGAWQQQFSPLEEPTVRPQWLSLQQGSQIVYEAPSHDPNTSKLCWIAELCNADEPRLHAMGLLAANHLAQCVQQHLAARYDIGYYGAIAPVVCAGKLWISITCNTFHDVSFVQRCIDGFVAESIESLRKLDGREFTRRWGMFAEQHHERSQRGFRSERNFLLEQLQSGVDSPFTLYTDVYNSLSTVSQQEVVQFMQTVLHPLSPRCTTISARLTTPRALSQSATQATLTFLKASGARIADNLSSSLLHGTTSLTDAISVFQQACAGAVTPEHVASIVRVAAETYPAGGSDTVRLPLEYPAEGAEEIIIDRFLQSTHFLDNIPDLRRRLRETPRGNGSRVALRSSLTMDQYETTWTKREESSGAMPVIPLLAAAVN
ncbi:hypothetical protein PsYK624_076690 [Phanerochaete sordida]|uniref:Peptidase M16 middle/third domain-containing protein n=1 Tax=Phanerochaete sordida TaxID=48140 RepID=A0A9P3GCW6_9APHY|nr:hypothetical protein PsYK624_076690 [Phanerochaete sordida]